MRSMYLLISLLVIMVATGPAVAAVSIGASTTAGAGTVYTSGNIYVSSEPSGASAVLDSGADVLFTPGTFPGVLPGQHTVVIAKPGFETSSSTVNVSTGTTQNLVVTLDRANMPGGISVSSTPKGVGVYVDFIYVGTTDLVVGNIASGSHLLTVVEPGYQAWSQSVTVVPQQVIPITVTLVPETNPSTGDLQVTSDPAGALVYLNGEYQGFTTQNNHLDVNDLAPGTYTINLTRVGYQVYSAPVTITAGQITRISPVLQPSATPAATASADIVSSPSGAEIYVDNVFVGYTPISFQNVTPGAYTIELRLAGYNTFTSSGQVQGGQDVHIVASLSPITPTTTPTPTKAPMSSLTVVATLGILCVAGILVDRRRRA